MSLRTPDMPEEPVEAGRDHALHRLELVSLQPDIVKAMILGLSTSALAEVVMFALDELKGRD